MTKYFTSTLLAAVLAIAPAISYADWVEIEFVSPEMTKAKTEKKKKKKGKPQKNLSTLQYDSGWPLTIKLVMNDELGITLSDGIGPFFPSRTQTGFIVFSDPDGCLAMDSVSWLTACFDPATSALPVSDELYVEFTPGIDEVGVPDDTGNSDLQAKLVDSYSAGAGPFSINATIGPETGGDVVGDLVVDVVDGYGRGADDDLPGLVVVAHHGQGIVWNETGLSPSWPGSYSPKQPLELINLAGYMNSVGYGLNDAKQRTFIMAQMIVPRGLFGPVVFFDTCYTSGAGKEDDESNCEAFWSIDGAAPEPLPEIGRSWIVTQVPRPQYR